MKTPHWIGIAILAVIVVYGAARLVQRGHHETRQRAIAELEEIEFALDRYAKDNGDYPSTEQGLTALWEYPTLGPAPSNWKGPYVDAPVVADPWGRAYVYRRPGINDQYTYDLLSYGEDGILGGRGDAQDVVSWLRPDEL